MASRDEIVQLIRLHSAQLQRAVSQRQFERLTGIKRHEWSGRYWARWNDALIEAGLAPNRFSQDSYAADFLLRSFADLTLELRRVPSHADLALKHNQDSSFPSAGTFQERLGGAEVRVRLLAQLALSEEAYKPVFELVSPMLTTEGPVKTPKAPTAQSFPGRVYLIRSGEYFKIGKTDDPSRRYGQIQLSVPGKVEEVHVLETDDPAGIEAYWHRRFASKRRAGEWFELSEADVAAFKRRGAFM